MRDLWDMTSLNNTSRKTTNNGSGKKPKNSRVDKISFYTIRKKHAALPLLVITLAFIFLIQNNIRSMAANSTFYIEDLQGQREQLNDVIVSGNLQDGYHNNIFTIENGNLEVKTNYYHHYKDLIPSKINQWFSKVINNIEYDLRLYFEGRNVTANIKYYDRNPKKSSRPSYGEAIIKTDIISEKYTSNSWTTATSASYVITNIGDRIFFTIPTTEGYGGTNGIFEVISFSDKLNYLLSTKIKQKEETDQTQNSQHGTNTNNQGEEAQIKTVAEFSIDINDQTETSYLEVLGLQAVDNNLVLILRQNSSLIFRAYDSESGEQTGGVIINDLSSYLERYEAFNDGNTLNLCFRKKVSGDERKILTFEIIDENQINKNEANKTDKNSIINNEIIKDRNNEIKNKESKIAENYYNDEDNDKVIMHGNLRLTNIIDAVYMSSEVDRIFNIYHKDNKVYIVLSLTESEENKNTPYYVLRPKQTLIYVYEGSKLAYKGEIITDMNQDDIFQLYEPSPRGGISYDRYERRIFEDIQIRNIK